MTTKTTKKEPPIAPNDSAMIDEFLTSVEDRQSAALHDLEARLETMGDQFAAQVRTMVERGLIAARGKAFREIQTIDVGFFLQAPMEILPGSQPILTESQEVNQ